MPTNILQGPLTPRQVTVMTGLMTGLRHIEIAKKYGIGVSVVRQEAVNITRKMRASTSAQAVASYAQAVVYRNVAARLRQGLIKDPMNAVEHHANHVLEAFARLYEDQAAARLPK